MNEQQIQTIESNGTPSGTTRSSRRHDKSRIKAKRGSYQNRPSSGNARESGVHAETPVSRSVSRDPRKFRDGMVLQDYRKVQPKLHEDRDGSTAD